MKYTVKDNIRNESIEFDNKVEAEMEAERRVYRHGSAAMIQAGNNTIVICRLVK